MKLVLIVFAVGIGRDNDFPLKKIDFSVSEKGKSVSKKKIPLSFCCQSDTGLLSMCHADSCMQSYAVP